MGKHSTRRVQLRLRRRKTTQKTIRGTASRPRLNIFRSNTHIYAQVIDDDSGRTLAAASSLSSEVKANGTDADKKGTAKLVGQEVAKRALAAGVTSVVFDRNGFKYHGRVAALADGAREGGLSF